MYYLFLKSPGRISSLIGESDNYFDVWDLFCRFVEDGHSEDDFMIIKHDPDSSIFEDVKIRSPFDKFAEDWQVCLH